MHHGNRTCTTITRFYSLLLLFRSTRSQRQRRFSDAEEERNTLTVEENVTEWRVRAARVTLRRRLSPLLSLDSSNSPSWRILLRVVERGLYPAGRRARARRGAIDWQARLPSFLPTNQSARSPGSEAAPLHHNKVRPRTDRPLVAELRPKHPAPFSQHFLPTITTCLARTPSSPLAVSFPRRKLNISG